MLAFRSAKDGLNCAIRVQRAIAARNDTAVVLNVQKEEEPQH